MNITEQDNFDHEGIVNSGFHVLTFAETGFAMLSVYGREFGLDDNVIQKFADSVNDRNEAGSLHPNAAVSAVPRCFIRDKNSADELARQITDFLRANQRTIKAKKILFDFRAGVAPFVIQACRMALESSFAEGIDEVLIIKK